MLITPLQKSNLKKPQNATKITVATMYTEYFVQILPVNKIVIFFSEIFFS